MTDVFQDGLRTLTRRIADEHGIDNDLFVSLVEAESSFNPSAVGPVTRSGERAVGLGQLMPATAKELGVIDRTNPIQNLQGVARLFNKNFSRFGSNELALAAHNAGAGAVSKAGGIPNFPETQNFVKKITARMNEIKSTAAQGVPVEVVESEGDGDDQDLFQQALKVLTSRKNTENEPQSPGFIDQVQNKVASFRQELAINKLKAGDTTDFEVLIGMPIEQFAQEHPTLSRIYQTAANSVLVGLTERLIPDAFLNPEGKARSLAAAEKSAEQLSIPADALATTIGFGPDILAIGAGAGALGALGLGATAATSVAGAGVLGAGTALQGGSAKEIGISAGAGALIPVGGKVVGKLLPKGLFGQTAAQGITGGAAFGALSGGDLRETAKGALIFGGARFGGGIGAKGRAAREAVAKVRDDQFRITQLGDQAINEVGRQLRGGQPDRLIDFSRDLPEVALRGNPQKALGDVPTEKRPAVPPLELKNAEEAGRMNQAEVSDALRAQTEAGEIKIGRGAGKSETLENIKSSNKNLEDALSPTRLKLRKAGIFRRTGRFLNEERKKRFVFLHKLNRPEFANTKEKIRVSNAIKPESLVWAENQIARVVATLDKPQLDLHSKFVQLKDWEFTAQRGLDLPRGVTLPEVQQELARITPLLPEPVTASIKRHQRLVQSVYADLFNSGDAPPGIVQNKWYFPHEVLDFEFQASGRRGKTKSSLRRKGSVRDVDSDYLNVMFRYLSRVRDDVRTREFFNDIMEAENKPQEFLVPKEDAALEIVEFVPDPGIWGPRARALPERLRQSMLDGIQDDAAAAKSLGYTPEQLLRIRSGELNLGKRFIPRALAETLNDPAQFGKGTQDAFINTGIKWFKGLALNSNPVRFNRRNFLGDAQRLFVLDPAAFRFVPEAMGDLIRAKRGEVTGKHQLAIEHAVTDSGRAAQENINLRAASRFKEFRTGEDPKQYASRLYNVLQNFAQGRENVLRLAKFYADLERVSNGKEPVTFLSDFRGMTDPTAKAAKSAREALGDYGAFTSFENRVLRNNFIPFYSWMKINTAFWPQALLSPGTGSRTAATVPLAAGRYAVGKAGLMAKVAGGYALTYQWNNTGWRSEIEEKLPDFQRQQFHIILGINPRNGEPIVITDPTPLDDFLRTIGIDGVGVSIRDAFMGRKTWAEVAKEYDEDGRFLGVPLVGYAHDAVVERLGPTAKVPLALSLGVETFPNPREFRITPAQPGPRLELAARSAGLGEAVRAQRITAGRKGDVTGGESLTEFLSPVGQRFIQAERGNYFDVTRDIQKFMRNLPEGPVTRGFGGVQGINTPLLLELSRASQSRDRDKIDKVLNKIRKSVRDKKIPVGLRASIMSKDPVRMIPARFRKRYISGLNDRERKKFDRARIYWKETFVEALKPIMSKREGVIP